MLRHYPSERARETADTSTDAANESSLMPLSARARLPPLVFLEMDIAASPIHVWCPQRFLISHASKSGSANQPPKASRSKLTSLIDRICRSNSRRSVPERGEGIFPAPFGSAIMRAPRWRPRQGRKEGVEGREGGRAGREHCGFILAETLSRMFLLLSLGSLPPSLPLPLPPSFLLVIHLTRFSLLCVCLSPSLFLAAAVVASWSLPPLSSTSFGLSCQPISSRPIWTGIKMEGSYQ